MANGNMQRCLTSLTDHQGNASENHNEIPLISVRRVVIKKKKI